MVERQAVVQMRLVVEAEDDDEAVRFYRDALGLQITLFQELLPGED